MKLIYSLIMAALCLGAFSCSQNTSTASLQKEPSSKLAGENPYAEFRSSVGRILKSDGGVRPLSASGGLNDSINERKGMQILKLLKGLGLAQSAGTENLEIASSAGALSPDASPDEVFMRKVVAIFVNNNPMGPGDAMPEIDDLYNEMFPRL